MKRFILSYLLLMGLAIGTAFGSEARLLRFPHIHSNKIVFTYGGDLYIVSSDGGVARKLTSHVGYEMFPKFSPDGKHIAFTGQYDGNTEVFIISSSGGTPKRITYSATLNRDDVGDRMGPNNIVLDWSPDGKSVLYRTRSFTFNDFTGQLMTVDINGGMPAMVPLVNGGFSSFSPDGKKLAYNYIFREFRSWKRYTGGMADDIRIFDFDTKESFRITDNIYQDIHPMWSKIENKVYYISDRDGIMNLYCYSFDDESTKQLTFYTDYDIKFPSIGDKFIVYEYGGYIHKYNIETNVDSRVDIQIANDLNNRPEYRSVESSIRSYSISSNGERVLLSARGDIFSVPVKSGITYNYTNSSAHNEMWPDWAPDGSGFAYISDKDGEFNIYFKSSDGKIDRKLTDIKGYIFGFAWSPDSKKILWSEKSNSLNILDIESGKNIEVEKSPISPINDYNWSPDSKYIVYTRPTRTVSTVILYNLEKGDKTQITDMWYSSFSPNFSSDGKYLLFVSNRNFSPTYSNTEWNHAYTNMSKVYILPLDLSAEIPFAPKNDSVNKIAQDDNSKNKDSKLNYSLINIESRIIEIPIPGSFYRNLHMVGDNIYYSTRGGTSMFNIKTKKEVSLGANIIFGPNYKKALAIQSGKVGVVDIPKAPVKLDESISFKDVSKVVDYSVEWIQIYDETWRQMRDFFYAKNMHGVDWDGVKDKYRELVPYVTHRSDLTYIIGEMIGELNVGHAYSQNGEKPEPKRIKMGLLGATFSKDINSGYFKIDSIIPGANWDSRTRSPLTMPGVDLQKGNYIVEIDGKDLSNTKNIFEHLIDKAGKIVELTVNTKPSLSGARRVLVEPIEDESLLYYHAWVRDNIRKVSEATNGEVGYIHIPDMGVTGLNEFVKHYYPQLTKKALIIDDRGNGGGNVSPMLIERLQRTITFFTMHTNQEKGALNPVGTFDGPKVLLINEYSASDGDLFPYRFRMNNLGTIIGRRSWGGVVGYSGFIPVVDGGSIVTPSYAPFAADGSGWIIEGEGVKPDIDIENDPYKEHIGIDQQLNKAIEVALEKISRYEYRYPIIPAFPDKSYEKNYKNKE